MRALPLVMVLCGCSWLTVTPPPEHPQSHPKCTESAIAPNIDAVVAAVLLSPLLVIGHLSPGFFAGEGHTDSQRNVVQVLVAAAAVGVVFGASAMWGNRTIERCRRLHAARVDDSLLRMR